MEAGAALELSAARTTSRTDRNASPGSPRPRPTGHERRVVVDPPAAEQPKLHQPCSASPYTWQEAGVGVVVVGQRRRTMPPRVGHARPAEREEVGGAG
jgi:hypothetical protein